MILKMSQKRMKSPIIRALLTLVSGQALGQAIGLITTPIVSRLYDTTAFGQFAIISSTATIICAVSQAGMASAIMMAEEEIEAKKVFCTAFWLQLMIITLFAISAVVIMPFYRFFNVGISYAGALGLLYIYMLLTNFSNLMRIYMNRKGLYRALFWNSMIGALSTLCVTIPLGMVGIGFMGFMLAALISTTLCALQMLFKANPFIRINFLEMVEKVKEYKDFVVYQLPANMVATFSQQLPNQMLNGTFGSSNLGSYSMSDKICYIPMRLIASPINTVYFKTAVDYKQNNKDLAGFTLSLVRTIMLISLIPIILLISFGEPIFAFVLGEKWRKAGQVASIMSFQYILVFCGICTSYCRVAIGRQKMNFAMSIVQLIAILSSLVIGLCISKDIITVITCFAIGNCIYQVFNMAVNFYCMKKHVLKYLAFVIIYCIVAYGVSFIL